MIIRRDKLRAMKKTGEQKMLTIKETAERLGASPGSVRVWVGQGRFTGARKESTPLGIDYWLIPESALAGFSMGRAGRPPRPDSELKYPRRPSRAKNN
jgi:hypothetical protein